MQHVPFCRTLVLFAALTLALTPPLLLGADRSKAPLNRAGLPVVDASGRHLNYSRAQLPPTSRKISASTAQPQANGAATHKPFFTYSVFGSSIGLSNIVIFPTPNGGRPQILLGGNSGSTFGGDNFWQILRQNPTTGDYTQLYVSPLYSATIVRLGLANVVGDKQNEIIVLLSDGNVYLYNSVTRSQVGHFNTGTSDLLSLSLTDLDGDGKAEVIVTSDSDLFVFNGTGKLLWKVAGAGGSDVAVGQMDNDPALEIAVGNGKVVDSSTHKVQWNYKDGFGHILRLAPLPGKTYQQLVAAEEWNYVYSYDVAQKLPRWSIHTQLNIDGLAIANVTGDSQPEVLVGDGQFGSIHIYDLITQSELDSIPNPDAGITDIVVADVNHDGAPEVLWGAGQNDTGPDHLYVASASGDHTIQYQSPDLEGPFLGPVIGDLDGDGKPELVVCSTYSDAGYSSGRILVFDLATLSLRAISPPVADNGAFTGEHDLKLCDLEGDGRKEVVIAGDKFYDGLIEIYGFDTSNTFTLKWSNTDMPQGSPFNRVAVTDLDGDGVPEIIGVNSVADSGSDGVYLYIYDYPATDNPFRSVALASDSFDPDLVVQDLNNDGSKEIAVLIPSDKLYTFDGPSRQLEGLVQKSYALLASQNNPPYLIPTDAMGVSHFLHFKNPKYQQKFSQQVAQATPDGVTVVADGLFTGADGILTLRLPPKYSDVAWQSPYVGPGFGHTVVTDQSDGQSRVFSADSHEVVGFTYP